MLSFSRVEMFQRSTEKQEQLSVLHLFIYRATNDIAALGFPENYLLDQGY